MYFILRKRYKIFGVLIFSDLSLIFLNFGENKCPELE